MPRKKVTLTKDQLDQLKNALDLASVYLNNLPYASVRALPQTLQSVIERAATDCRLASELMNRVVNPELKTTNGK